MKKSLNKFPEKYFAKYLPVEGKIEFGDWYIDDVGQVRQNIVNDTDYWSLRNDYRKVKLFLCSRDIQVGDKVYHNYMKSLTEKYQPEEVEDTEDLEHLLKYNPYKIIGEISPEATWVKEGDEFGEDEVKRDVLVKDTFDNDYTHRHPKVGEEIKLGSTEKFICEYPIKILGPCKHFH